MPLWKLAPTARLDDPRWLDHHYKKTLFVYAESPTDARVKAAEWERRSVMERLGNESPADRSAFEDAKLYHVVEIEDEYKAIHTEQISTIH